MAMTQDQAQTWIVTSLAVTGCLAVVHDTKAGKLPTVRLAVGLTVAGIFLATMAQGAPQLGGMGALLMLTGSVFAYGPGVWMDVAGASDPAKGGQTPSRPGGTGLQFTV